jgi:RNA-binding protein
MVKNMLTSKQRAKLRGLANPIETIFRSANRALSTRLLNRPRRSDRAGTGKMRVLENAPLSPKEAAAELAEKTRSECVQVIGTRWCSTAEPQGT